jgi:hypothetical protein
MPRGYRTTESAVLRVQAAEKKIGPGNGYDHAKRLYTAASQGLFVSAQFMFMLAVESLKAADFTLETKGETNV